MYYAYHFYDAERMLRYTGFSSDLYMRQRLLQNRWPNGYIRIEAEFTSWMDALDWENRKRREGYPTETLHHPKKKHNLRDQLPPDDKPEIKPLQNE
ncbi:MAG: hypothetical protein ACR2OT_02495 [Parvibaculales bacterium]